MKIPLTFIVARILGQVPLTTYKSVPTPLQAQGLPAVRRAPSHYLIEIGAEISEQIHDLRVVVFVLTYLGTQRVWG